MLTKARHDAIVDYVDTHLSCRIKELCDLLDTSESTVRRDLVDLAKQGRIKRVHGGALTIKNSENDVSQKIRFSLNISQKKAIANYAVDHYVHSGMRIYLDAGTTIYQMIPALKQVPDLLVVTNAPATALALIEAGISTIMLGGILKEETQVVVGGISQKQLADYHFSWAILGANGLSSTGKLTTPDVKEASLKEVAIAQADNSIVLLDDSKIGQQNFATFADAKSVKVITNQLSQKNRARLPEGIKLEEVN
ncbi:MAG: DeoR/GlpR family DNA-binding transcription regulator [Lactobacillus sp.]|nr:DeoR/GlpR family DNA-binding transcription regulator [Lactobacillus sp.]